MPNAVYTTILRELEVVMPPRVVSQSLNEGLSALGKSADVLAPDDATMLLRQHIEPRLSILRGEETAKNTVEHLLRQIANLPAESLLPPVDLYAQQAQIDALKEAQSVYKYFFEWPETQKLRSIIAQIEADHVAEKNAELRIEEARGVLQALSERLDGELHKQAEALAALAARFAGFAATKTPKVRRVANLLDVIRQSQGSRQIASGEVERAEGLLARLEADAAAQAPSAPSATPVAPSTTATAETAPAAAPAAPSPQAAPVGGREAEIAALLEAYSAVLNAQPDLKMQLREMRERAQEGRVPDIEFLAVKQVLERHADAVEEAQEEAGDKVAKDDFVARLAEVTSAFERLGNVNTEEAFELRMRLKVLQDAAEQLEQFSSSHLQSLLSEVDEADKIIHGIREQVSTTSDIASQIMQGDAFDDLFDLFDAPSPPAFSAADDAPLQAFLQDVVAQEGVRGALLQGVNDLWQAGNFPGSAEALAAVVREQFAQGQSVARELVHGRYATLSVDSDDVALLGYELPPQHLLIVVLEAGTWLASLRHYLDGSLPLLDERLEAHRFA